MGSATHGAERRVSMLLEESRMRAVRGDFEWRNEGQTINETRRMMIGFGHVVDGLFCPPNAI